MKIRSEGKREVKEVYVPGKTSTLCDGCGKEITNIINMRLLFNDFGDDSEGIPDMYEQWDFCGFRCFGSFYSKKEVRNKLKRMFNHCSHGTTVHLELRECDLSVMADAANLLTDENKHENKQ